MRRALFAMLCVRGEGEQQIGPRPAALGVERHLLARDVVKERREQNVLDRLHQVLAGDGHEVRVRMEEERQDVALPRDVHVELRLRARVKTGRLTGRVRRPTGRCGRLKQRNDHVPIAVVLAELAVSRDGAGRCGLCKSLRREEMTETREGGRQR